MGLQAHECCPSRTGLQARASSFSPLSPEDESESHPSNPSFPNPPIRRLEAYPKGPWLKPILVQDGSQEPRTSRSLRQRHPENPSPAGAGILVPPPQSHTTADNKSAEINPKMLELIPN